MTRFCLCLLALASLGCAQPAAGPAFDMEAERHALMEADEAWSESHEDVERFLTFLTEDALFMPDDAPLARGEAIRTTWEALLALPGFSLAWSPATADVSASGDMGYTAGSYELNFEQNGSPVVTVGKYLTVWKRQADGSWKVAADCFNTDAPAGGG